jgi:LmbE family N-acetylglucosaminyl deacetylase
MGGLEPRRKRPPGPVLRLSPAGAGLELLCLGAHSDDLELGCSGTILRLLDELQIDRVTWVVLSGDTDRAVEAERSCQRLLDGRCETEIHLQQFRDGFFPYTAAPIKEFFESLKASTRPDLILTHYREDRHQDHRLTSELTYNTFRDHLILEYEVMKKDGDLGQPNTYVPLDEATAQRKVQLLMEGFGSQRDKTWFSEDAFLGLMRLRGIEAGAPSGYAEAFYGRKILI